MRVLLVDNGSLKAEAVLRLRAVAAALTERSGVRVEPASLLHSSRVPAALLGGQPATTWERALKAGLEAGERAFLVLPYFFGPTGAVLDYMPRRLEALRERLGPFAHTVAPFLYDPGETALAQLLADQVRATARAQGLGRPRVVLVDHGSPRREVAAVRDAVAGQLRDLLGAAASAVVAASMERREGEAYAFNEPLLARALHEAPLGDPVIVAHLFLSPGRHAGPGGDIATICAEARRARPGLQLVRGPLLGEHPGMIELLARRLAQGLERAGQPSALALGAAARP